MSKKHKKITRQDKAANCEDAPHPDVEYSQFKIQKTKNHLLYEQALNDRYGTPVVCYGSAGTGKTFGALKSAVDRLEKDEIKRIICLRPQEAFAAKSGYLPGTEREKMDPWIRPIQQNLMKLGYSQRQLETMEKYGAIQYYDLGMVQGLTFDEAIVIVDECQNMTLEQIKGLLTREGMYSSTVLCGDIAQVSPMFKDSGLATFIELCEDMNTEIHMINMTRDDVVRSERCRRWIADFEDWEAGIRPCDYEDDEDEEKPDPLSLYDFDVA